VRRNLSPPAARIGGMTRSIPLLVLAAALAVPAAARAAGGPVAPLFGGPGVASLDGTPRFVALDARGTTIVESLREDGGVRSWRSVRGRFGVATVAQDASATGLSLDGRTLVLEAPVVYPYRRTRLAVLDARTLAVRRRVTLPGWFALDGLSPSARRLYLTHYTHPLANLSRYEVRAYDVARGRLSPHPIVDPREPDEKMLGVPLTRTMSARGRWAYTLYDRANGDAPFVHALDTVRGRAFCVDLDGVAAADVVHLHLAAPQDGPVRVVHGERTVALIDRRTFRVSRPAAARAARPAPRAEGGAGALLPLAGLGLILAVWTARRRYARSASFRNAS
jgi:hypothetical protein